MSDEQMYASTAPILPGMTRRQMLRALVTVGATAFAGSALLTACNDPNPSTVDITLITTGWPVVEMPSAEAQKADIKVRAFAVSLQDWLDRNPGVKLKTLKAQLDTADKLKAAIAANAAPDWYGDLGDPTTNRFAHSLGYAAETTDLVQQYKVDSLLADYALPRWHTTWDLNGRFFGLPGDTMTAGVGLMYRRDLIQELGLIEPKQGWSWEDFRNLAKGLIKDGTPGVGVPLWMIGYLVNSGFLEDLAKIPKVDASWHYRYNYAPFLAEWTNRVNLYRSMYLDDKSITQSSTFNEYTLTQDFIAGKYALVSSVALFFTVGGFDAMSAKYGRVLDDLVGYVPYPFGSNGAFSGSSSDFGNVMLNPHRDTTALAKAADMWFYMFYGAGYINQRAMRYEVTKDPRQAYDYITPGNRFQKNPNIPVTVEDAWGARFVQSWMDCINTPSVINPGFYFSPETSTEPPDIHTRHDAALLALSTTQGDIPTILNTLANQYNDEAATMRSSIESGTFKNSARNYYGALNTFWQTNSPTFFQGDWSNFYRNEVLPSLA